MLLQKNIQNKAYYPSYSETLFYMHFITIYDFFILVVFSV